MNARSPSAFLVSALLHGAVVAALVLTAFVLQPAATKPPVVFELVAGAGDNYAATEAPALGSPDGKVELTIPKQAPSPAPAAPAAEEAPPAPAEEASPVVPRAPDTAEVAPVRKTAPAQTRTFTRTIRRIEAKKIKKAEAQIKARREADAKRMSKEEFDRQHAKSAGAGKAGAAAAHGGAVPRIDAKGIAAGVQGGSANNTAGGAGGKALAREEQSLLDSYYALLKQRLHDALQKPPGLSDRLVTKIQIHILADGTLTDAQVLQSSGSPEFDQAALAAVAATGSIGPKPDGRGETLTFEFRMLDPDGAD